MKTLINFLNVSTILLVTLQGNAFAAQRAGEADGSWKIVDENAVFTIRGNTATMITGSFGCTEISHIAINYSADNNMELMKSAPMESIPAGCIGVSAPFSAANGIGIIKSSLEYSIEGANITFKWYYTNDMDYRFGPIFSDAIRN